MPQPSVHAVLVADSVFRDPRGKYLIVGPFSNIWSRDFPSRMPLAIYARFGDFIGKHKLLFELVDSEEQPLMRVEADAESKQTEPTTIDFGIPAQVVTFKGPGSYYLRTSIDGELVHYEAKIVVAHQDDLPGSQQQ